MKHSLFYILYGGLAYFSSLHILHADIPRPKCDGLPGCDTNSQDGGEEIIAEIIATTIQYVAVIAVMAVIYGGVLYLLSAGEDEKTKKAKSVIIWALVGVFISVLAWSIITLLNTMRIGAIF